MAAPADTTSDLAQADREFAEVARLRDPVTGEITVRVMPGQYYVTGDAVAVSTTLGSCVAACVRDPESGIGGLNHFMLPDSGAMSNERCTRYGQSAMDALIKQVRQRSGGATKLEVKVFGGGNVIDLASNPVGERNIAFVRGYLADAGVEIVSEDLGGPHPRKVVYYPATGRVLLRRMRRLQRGVVAAQEREFCINAAPTLR